MSIKTFFIILYIFLTVILYIWIVKRLKFLNNKHTKLIWVKIIKPWCNGVVKVIFVLLLIDAILSVILTLTLL